MPPIELKELNLFKATSGGMKNTLGSFSGQ